jgi:F420H(2)-dependent quinone reductase
MKEQLLRRVMKLVGAAHIRLYRATGGRIGRRFRGGDVLLLTVTGRKSGRRLTSPLLYVRDGDAFVVAASFAGVDREPAWWLNLQSLREATVQVDREVLEVRAEKATGDDRAELWRRLNESFAGYEGYQRAVSRQIAVVRLRPAA